ncbi:MAG: type IV pilus inner membrane component PilO [Planctomycetota bacterium]|jgi:Tfp pilus assembly protein PilO
MLFRGRQQITICAIGAAIACVFMVLWYLPLRRKTKEIEQVKAKRALTIAKGTADARQTPLLQEQLRKLQARIGDFEASIPEQRAHGGFLQRITDLMKDHDLKDEVIKPGEEIRADKFTCIPVSMECKGELAQISEFYRRLQNLDRLVRIEKVTLNNDESYGGQVTMKTEAVVYYRAKVGQGQV